MVRPDVGVVHPASAVAHLPQRGPRRTLGRRGRPAAPPSSRPAPGRDRPGYRPPGPRDPDPFLRRVPGSGIRGLVAARAGGRVLRLLPRTLPRREAGRARPPGAPGRAAEGRGRGALAARIDRRLAPTARRPRLGTRG